MAISDQQIAADVRAHLEWDSSVDHSRINVEVARGYVTLTGEVPSLSARNSATIDVLSLRGVRGIDNQLTVTFPEEADSATGTALADSARLVLSGVLGPRRRELPSSGTRQGSYTAGNG